LVNYATSNGIEEFDIVWTNHQVIDNSIFVLGNSTMNTILAGGAFQITPGAEFYENNRSLFEADEIYDESDEYYITNSNYVIWRICDEDYLNTYPDNMLWYFEIDGVAANIWFIVWPEIEQFSEWALIPK
jgi:hypothetical protein